MKLVIRLTLVAASACMVWGNWHTTKASLTASFLFLTANLASLIYNELRRKS